METHRSCWAVIPAAGVGTRMSSTIPKQYLPLAGKTILEHTLKPFCEHSAIHRIVVVLAENDKRWNSVSYSHHPKIHTTTGGLQRYHSVLNGLKYIQNLTNTDDWVLVHDAARPCIRSDDIDSLIAAVDDCTDGAILGLPVRDTMKRADTDRKINETVNRDNLWHALTPQLFRLSVLRKAIENTIVNSIEITDEAQAVEIMGLRPLLVEGHPDNIKITHPSDMTLAELYLAQQEKYK